MLNPDEILTRVKDMRSQIKESDAYVCRFDEADVDSFNNFLIWDDDRLLLHCVTHNTDLETQMDWPVRIKSFDYSKLEFISTLYTDIEGGN